MPRLQRRSERRAESARHAGGDRGENRQGVDPALHARHAHSSASSISWPKKGRAAGFGCAIAEMEALEAQIRASSPTTPSAAAEALSLEAVQHSILDPIRCARILLGPMCSLLWR